MHDTSHHTLDWSHHTLVCPKGHGPMTPVASVAGTLVRRFECHGHGCRNAGQVPAEMLAAGRRVRVPALAGAR